MNIETDFLVVGSGIAAAAGQQTSAQQGTEQQTEQLFHGTGPP